MGYKNGTGRLREWIDTAMAVGDKIKDFHHYVVEMSCSSFENIDPSKQIKDTLVVYATPCKEGRMSPIGESVKGVFNNDEVSEFFEEMTSVLKSPRCRIHIEVLPTFIFCIEPTEEFPYRVEISGSDLNLKSFTNLMDGTESLSGWLGRNTTNAVGGRYTLYICSGHLPQVNNLSFEDKGTSTSSDKITTSENELKPTVPTTKEPEGLGDDVLSFMDEATKSVTNMKENEERCIQLGEESKNEIDKLIKSYTDAVEQERSTQMKKSVEENLNKLKGDVVIEDDLDMFDETEDVNSSSISIGDGDESEEISSSLPESKVVETTMENPMEALMDSINRLSLNDQKVLAESVTLGKIPDGPLGEIANNILALPLNMRTNISKMLNKALSL